MNYYDDDNEKKRRRRVRNTVTAIIVIGALAVGGKYLYDNQNSIFKKDKVEQSTSEEEIVPEVNEIEEEVVPEPITEVEPEEIVEPTVDIETIDALKPVEVVQTEEVPEPVTEVEPEEIVEPVTEVEPEEVIDDTLQIRAKALADFYVLTGAYNPTYGIYRNDDMTRIIQIMNGDYKVEDKAAAEVNYDYLMDYYTATLNSERYIDKVNGYINNENDAITSISYNLDLTDTILEDKNYKAFALIDYLDDIHKRAMTSGSKEEVRSLCKDFFGCLANLAYGKGYYYNGVNYTIEDLKGIENVGLGSILEQCVFDLIPFTYKINEISYTDKNGNNTTIDIDTLNNTFNFQGSYITDWKDDLTTSMTR